MNPGEGGRSTMFAFATLFCVIGCREKWFRPISFSCYSHFPMTSHSSTLHSVFSGPVHSTDKTRYQRLTFHKTGSDASNFKGTISSNTRLTEYSQKDEDRKTQRKCKVSLRNYAVFRMQLPCIRTRCLLRTKQFLQLLLSQRQTCCNYPGLHEITRCSYTWDITLHPPSTMNRKWNSLHAPYIHWRVRITNQRWSDAGCPKRATLIFLP